MKLLIISDLHLGKNDHFETFQWNRHDFIQTLEDTINKYQVDQLILNGDILEMMKYPYRKIILYNRDIIRYFLQKKAIWIKGNHDMLNPLARDAYLYRNGNGQTIYIEHGNKADFLNGTKAGRTLGKLLLRLLRNLIKSRNLYSIYYKTLLKFEQINHIPKKYNTYKYLQYALKLLKTYDVVILGHTHKLESHHTYYLHRKKRYINSGSCSMNRFQAILIDTETLAYKMINLQPAGEPPAQNDITEKAFVTSAEKFQKMESSIY